MPYCEDHRPEQEVCSDQNVPGVSWSAKLPLPLPEVCPKPIWRSCQQFCRQVGKELAVVSLRTSKVR